MGIFVCAVFIIVSQIKQKGRRFNILFVFNLLWLVVIIFSKIQLYGLYEASERAYNLITIGVLCFDIGYCCCNKIIKFKGNGGNDYHNTVTIIRYRVIYLLCVIVCLFYLKDLAITLPKLLSGQGLEVIRQLAQNSNSELYSSRSTIEGALRTLFVNPYMVAIQSIVAVDFWIGKRDKLLFCADVLLCLMNMLSDGSRTCLLYLAIQMAVIYFFSGKHLNAINNIKLMNKTKRRLIFITVGGLGVLILVLATISRSGQNAIRYLYYYYSMEPYMLDTWMSEVDKLGSFGFGLSSFCGYTFSIIYFVKNLFGLSSYPEFAYNVVLMTTSTDQTWKIISSMGSPANAYVSLFWFPYYDGRIVGVAILMVLYGLFIKQIYLRAHKTMNAKYLALYALLFVGIFMSYIRFQFSQVAQALAFIYIILLFHNQKKKTIIDNNQ